MKEVKKKNSGHAQNRAQLTSSSLGEGQSGLDMWGRRRRTEISRSSKSSSMSGVESPRGQGSSLPGSNSTGTGHNRGHSNSQRSSNSNRSHMTGIGDNRGRSNSPKDIGSNSRVDNLPSTPYQHSNMSASAFYPLNSRAEGESVVASLYAPTPVLADQGTLLLIRNRETSTPKDSWRKTYTNTRKTISRFQVPYMKTQEDMTCSTEVPFFNFSIFLFTSSYILFSLVLFFFSAGGGFLFTLFLRVRVEFFVSWLVYCVID
ncbi:hypothetical protein L873DRAFT_1511122 [Choiromyces venosus 120613-1]|uniref:Uncharacterized protein n=1 Tax=Choiromyces venosus 120613-1 TaxID=1336337 RepID=A0A3N4J9Q7_9PEZI|nr:hypothetical protein L873DRAFT_1511122 [Choiromyces venosus 120613-1]